MTDPDFPAAHSMDTSWYVVDPAGHVALFETGENGPAPVGAEYEIYLSDLFRRRHPDAPDFDHPPSEAMAEEFGFFLYGYGDSFDPIDVYARRVVPPNPVHVDQLPPDIRDGCKKYRMPIAFAAAERVQPIDFFKCACWYEEGRDAYLAADGVTVRPVRGHEDRFTDFVLCFREESPDEAAKYRFEGIDDGP
ncbi:MAG: hypothetical protein J2P46_08330 [Zavarzinella sp.]|nr:hypothetical protein [Zavarzinella sp.]